MVAVAEQLESVVRLKLTSNTGARVKRVHYAGRDYLVAPASLIVPGVLNGSDGAGYYPLDECVKNAKAWDDMPIVVYHPTKNGSPVAAGDPEHSEYVLRESGIGFLRNARDVGKLAAEAWFDEEYVQDYDRKLQPQFRIYPRLLRNESIELSTGLIVHKDYTAGVCPKTGRSYDWVARNHVPDHLAVLPDQRGACSVQDGCGITVNDAVENADDEGWVTLPNGVHIQIKDGEIVKGPDIGSKGRGEKDDVSVSKSAQAKTEKATKSASADDHKSASEAHRDAAKHYLSKGDTAKAKAHSGLAVKHAQEYATKKDKRDESHSTSKKESGSSTETHESLTRKVDDLVKRINAHGGGRGKAPTTFADEERQIAESAKDVTARMSREELAQAIGVPRAATAWSKSKLQDTAVKRIRDRIGTSMRVHNQDQTTNEETDMAVAMTPEIREGLVARLVANCKCEGASPDADVLNKLSDATLLKLNSMPEALAKAKSGKAAPEEEEEDDEDDKGGKYTKNKAVTSLREETQLVANQETKQPMTAKEWLEAAPPEIRSAVTNALKIERNAKQACVDRLMAAVPEAKKESYGKLLANKELPELEMLVDMMPPTRNVSEVDQLFAPVYAGGGPEYAGGSGRSVQNAVDVEPELTPVTNWEEEQVREERLNRGRRTEEMVA